MYVRVRCIACFTCTFITSTLGLEGCSDRVKAGGPSGRRASAEVGTSPGSFTDPQFSQLTSSCPSPERAEWAQRQLRGQSPAFRSALLFSLVCLSSGFPGGSAVKNPPANAGGPWVGKLPWSRKWQPTALLLPGKAHRQRGLAGRSPQCCKEMVGRDLVAKQQQYPLNKHCYLV